MGPDRVLDRNRRVHAAEAVDVDVIGAQALQGVGQEVPYRHRPSVDADEGIVEGAQGAELDAEDHAVAVPAPQRLADEQLVVAHAVVVAGIEQGDPGIQRRADGGDALGLVGGTVGAGHAHAAQTDRRHLRTG